MLLERPVSARTLMRHHAALARGDASPGRIEEAEQAFRRTNRPVPAWMPSVPLVLAGVGSIIGTAQPGVAERDRGLALGIGAMDAILAVIPFTIATLSPQPYDEYLRESVRLAPIGPTGSLGATTAGRF